MFINPITPPVIAAMTTNHPPQNASNHKMDERENLIRVTIILEQLAKKVDAIQVSMDRIENEFIVKATAEAAVASTKVDRLEKIVFGTIGVLAVEVIVLIHSIFENNG